MKNRFSLFPSGYSHSLSCYFASLDLLEDDLRAKIDTLSDSLRAMMKEGDRR